MVIRVGDRVYDGSVKTQLEAARRAMIDRITEQLEIEHIQPKAVSAAAPADYAGASSVSKDFA